MRDGARGREAYDKHIEKCYGAVGFSDWKTYTGDDFFTRYLYLPAEYNSCSMYRGNRWHGITYDANCDDIRYSIVGVMR